MSLIGRKHLLKAVLCAAIFALEGMNYCLADFSIPVNVDPGAINRDLKLQSETRFIPERQEEIDTSNIITKEASAVYSQQKFMLKKIIYSGNTVFREKDFEKLNSKIIGKNISLNDLNAFADSITEMYKKEGYLTSKAIIPPQAIKDGVVLIQIIEGKIGNIKIEGGKWVKTSYVRNNILKSNNLEEDKLFNINDLSRSMAELNSPKYLKGQVALEKGAEKGETDIVLELKDRFPFSLGLGWDNTGRDLVGIQRAGVFASLDNLTGIGDRVWVNNTFATGTYGLDSGYSLPIGEKGTKLVLGYSLSSTKLGGDYRPQDIRGKSSNFTTAIVHPIKKGKNYEVNSRLAFDMMNAKTTIFGDQSLKEYQLRVLRMAISANRTDSNGRWIGDAVVSTGLPFLGGTQADTYGEPSSKFVKFNSYITRVQKLPKNALGIARFNTQISSSSLFPAEQMQIGGAYTVRGYNEASLLGDTGYVLSFEARTPIAFLPRYIEATLRKGKKMRIPIKDSIKFAIFYDQGFTYLTQQDTGPTSQNFYNSVGAGLRVNVGKHMTANFDLGIPLGPPKYDGQSSVRAHFSLSTDFL